MAHLFLGLFLWSAGHFFKRLAPGVHAGLGGAGKAVSAAVILGGLALMGVGYQRAGFVNLWYPPGWAVHLNNLLMLGAVLLFGMSATRGRLRGRLRHPQLAAVKTWAVAHLLVNGDLASVVLFGGLLIWAAIEVTLINRSEVWVRPEPGPAGRDVVLVAITLAMFGAIAVIHNWLGVWPFPG